MTDAMVGALRGWLQAMGPEERAEFVARNPAAYASPRPRTLHQLAVRLLDTTKADADDLDRGELQLLEAVVSAAGLIEGRHTPGACSRTALETLLRVGSAVSAERVNEVMDCLETRLLAWAHGDQVLIHPTVASLFRAPLGQRSTRDPKPTGPAPLVAERPVPKTRPVSGQATATVAAAAALRWMDKLLQALAEPSWPALQKGGLSVKEVRRLGRLLHVPEEEARLWLHLADGLDLIETRHGRWQPRKQAAAWSRAEPAARLADLGRALLGLTVLPLLALPDPNRPQQTATALSSGATVREAWQIRRTVLQLLAGLPAGHGALVDQELTAAVYHQCPTAFAPCGHRPPLSGDSLLSYMSIWCSSALEADAVIPVVMRELELLALTADGALTDLGRALVDRADSEQQLTAATELLPLQEQAAVLADHLVVVTGVPILALTAVLEDLCDLERSDTHTQSWRISPSSVRRYFDTHPGADPSKALARLEAVSSTPIPQTVAYLITDTAQRHGHISVGRAPAVLDVQSEALAAELVHRRELRHLGLRQVSPTVLLAETAPKDVLKALRDAGYAPSSRLEEQDSRPARGGDGGGGEVYEVPPQLRGRPSAKPPKDYLGWIAALPADEEMGTAALAGHIGKLAPALGAADCTALAAAVDSGGGRVHIEYRTGNGGRSTVTVNGPRLEGRCLTGKASRGYHLPLYLDSLRLVLPLPAPRSGKRS
ncbi:helicase-associated domain-containing protein [Streptomyces sp. NPDC058268]|uniref:helicase-associated domain-containing protein n=1 Tax=Streptomyces sp. NPDC058268 TaxID=3346413 RepID=UPI0036EF46B5